MKIQRFNESEFNPKEKVYRVTFSGQVDVPLSVIEQTDRYQQYISDKNFRVWAGLEEYFYEAGQMHFTYELYDGAGNPIEDEEEFDKRNKYNL